MNRRALLAGSTGSLLALAGLTRVSANDGTPAVAAAISSIDVGDVKLLGISPDGSTLLGRGRDSLVFLDANSLEEISRSDVSKLGSAIDEESFAWSPDGSTVAQRWHSASQRGFN